MIRKAKILGLAAAACLASSAAMANPFSGGFQDSGSSFNYSYSFGGGFGSTNTDWLLLGGSTPLGSLSGSWYSGSQPLLNWLSGGTRYPRDVAVPAPATLGLLGLGLCAVGLFRRLRKTAHA